MPIEQTAVSAAPYVRSIVRIVVALLFLEHGLSRLFGWPSPLPTPPVLSMYWFAGAIELCGGILLGLGLFTRPAAFVMSGEPPFPGNNASTILAQQLANQFDAQRFPEPVGAWLKHALDSDPSKRFPDAATMQQAWREVVIEMDRESRRGDSWWTRLGVWSQGQRG